MVAGPATTCRQTGRLASDSRSPSNTTQVVAPGVELRTAWRDGTTQLLLEPLEFLEKLAALTPRPEVRLLLYHAGPARRLASASGGSRRLPGTDKDVYVSYELAPLRQGCATLLLHRRRTHRPVRLQASLETI